MTNQPTQTPEFALGYRQLMLGGLAGELELTKRVIAAIPDDKSGYRHDPNGRTAWELAWHLANTDVQFMNGGQTQDSSGTCGVVRRQLQEGSGSGRRTNRGPIAHARQFHGSVQFSRRALSGLSE